MKRNQQTLLSFVCIILVSALVAPANLKAQEPGSNGSIAEDTRQKILELLAHPEHSQGEMAGHMTATSAILQTRLTLTNQAFNHDYIGCPGWSCFEYTDKPNRTKTQKTAWFEALPDNDYIVKVKLEGLNPNTTYYYRLLYGLDTETLQDRTLV